VGPASQPLSPNLEIRTGLPCRDADFNRVPPGAPAEQPKDDCGRPDPARPRVRTLPRPVPHTADGTLHGGTQSVSEARIDSAAFRGSAAP
jgi:hypothetical protein